MLPVVRRALSTAAAGGVPKVRAASFCVGPSARRSPDDNRCGRQRLFKIGQLNHVAIAVPNLEKAAALYRDVLGGDVSAPQVRPALRSPWALWQHVTLWLTRCAFGSRCPSTA